MTPAPARVDLQVDPGFAEAAVWRVLAEPNRPATGPLTDDGLGPGAGAGADHRRRVDAVYDLDDVAARETAFARLALGEFERLGLAEPLLTAIAERPTVAARVRVVLVGQARGLHDEGVTWEPGGAHLGIRVEGARFGDPEGLLEWARHALGHTEDAGDEAFGYRPGWEATADGRIPAGTQARLHRLWDIAVDGRLAAAGLLADTSVIDARRAGLGADLSGVAPDTIDAVFASLWEGPLPTFAQLLAWAARPIELVAAIVPGDPGLPRPDRCPLCRFPGDDVGVPERTIAVLVAAEYPDWRPEHGLCGRCTDRYRFAGRLGGVA